MVDFKQAVKWLLEDKYVMRKGELSYIMETNEGFHWQAINYPDIGPRVRFSREDFKATDWEIYTLPKKQIKRKVIIDAEGRVWGDIKEFKGDKLITDTKGIFIEE